MLPLLPFIAGIAAGAAATELWRRDAVQKGFGRARRSLKRAASTGVDNVRQGSAALRKTVTETVDSLRGKASGAQADAAHAARRAAAKRVRAAHARTRAASVTRRTLRSGHRMATANASPRKGTSKSRAKARSAS